MIDFLASLFTKIVDPLIQGFRERKRKRRGESEDSINRVHSDWKVR